MPDRSLLLKLLDEVYLEEMPLFNRRLEFFQMRQRTGEGEMVEQFVELLEAREREAEVHLMSREDLIMFRCHTGVVEEGMLTEWWRLENPSLPEMKRAMTKYKAGKAQKKALKKDREKDAARAPRAREKGPVGGGGKKKRSPSCCAVPPEWRELCLQCEAKGHMAAACSKRREDVNCDSCGRQGHMSKVCLTSCEEKNSSAPKKRDKTPGPSIRVTKEAAQEPWMTECEDEDEGNADHVHLVRAAASGYRSTPVLQATVQQGAVRAAVRCTPDTGATRTVVVADTVCRLGLATTASSARLYTAKARERMECSRQTSFYMRARTEDGRPGPKVLVEALVSKDLTDEVLVSWHDLIRLGVLSTTFPDVDSAQVWRVESADGLRPALEQQPLAVLDGGLRQPIRPQIVWAGDLQCNLLPLADFQELLAPELGPTVRPDHRPGTQKAPISQPAPL